MNIRYSLIYILHLTVMCSLQSGDDIRHSLFFTRPESAVRAPDPNQFPIELSQAICSLYQAVHDENFDEAEKFLFGYQNALNGINYEGILTDYEVVRRGYRLNARRVDAITIDGRDGYRILYSVVEQAAAGVPPSRGRVDLKLEDRGIIEEYWIHAENGWRLVPFRGLSFSVEGEDGSPSGVERRKSFVLSPDMQATVVLQEVAADGSVSEIILRRFARGFDEVNVRVHMDDRMVSFNFGSAINVKFDATNFSDGSRNETFSYRIKRDRTGPPVGGDESVSTTSSIAFFKNPSGAESPESSEVNVVTKSFCGSSESKEIVLLLRIVGQ